MQSATRFACQQVRVPKPWDRFRLNSI